MAKLVLKSNPQILASQISKFLSETGINDINAGSFLLTLLEASAREDFQQYVQMLKIIRIFNLDTTTGDDLDNKAFEFGLERLKALKASGNITILREASFVKVATSFYSGLPSPISGNMQIFVNDASNILYGTAGTLILGRGTSNEEEIAYTTAPVDNTNYWTFNLSTPLAKDHGLDESVILKQGVDQTINAGTIIVVPASGSSPAITFATVQDQTLLAGEAELDNVAVLCSQEGSIGNIPIGAITGEDAFVSPPFAGARAENDAKFTTGRDRENDDDLRDRIKNTIQSLSRGVKTAILNAIIGLVDPDSAKRVVSANVVLPITTDEHVKVYIDDGTGFEPSFNSEGFETLLDSATGGELRLQLDNAPLVKAQVETNNSSPYNMSAGSLTLTYQVGLSSETITFFPGDFSFATAATAEEVVRAINNKTTLIEARTANGGSDVVIQARADTNEDIQVTGGSANSVLAFGTDAKSTLFLYKNDKKLSKDGSTAFVDTVNQQTFNFNGLGASPWPLNIIVDGKSANAQQVNFIPGDFVDPSAALASEVAVAINERLAGATATLVSNDTKVRLTSNTTNSAKSKVEVTGGAANAILAFSTVQKLGTDKDYTLNRFLGTIELVTPAAANDNFTSGSIFTRAFLRTASPEFFNITSGQTLRISIDGGVIQVITFTSTGTFSAVQVAAFINAQLQGGSASVRQVGGQNFLEVTTGTYTEADGSIEIDSSSTATALNFPYDTTVTNQRPHKAFVVSGTTGPWAFTQGQTVVIVVDNDPSSKTFTVLMDFDGAVTAATSATVFNNLNFNTIFSVTDILKNFSLVFKSGGNSTTGSVASVANVSGNTWRYTFASLPANLADFAAGDEVSFSNMTSLANDGTFIVTAVNATGAGYIQVVNSSGAAEPSSSGSALIGQRRTITAYNSTTGQITVGSAFRVTPTIADQFAVLPNTVKNVVDYFNDTKITTLSTKATIESVEVSTKVQISSKSEGSDGYVQVTGGSANKQFQFETAAIRGLQGYNYYTGLVELVHNTIYGDDRDLASFPGIGAAGIDFEIISPTVEEISFNIDVTLGEGNTLSNLEDEIRSAITGYVNSLGVNDDVILAEVVAAIIGVSGVTDVDILSPTANIVIADSEIPRTRDSLIILG